MQTDAQKLVVVRDQFALKGLSDDALKQIRPVYQNAISRLLDQLKSLPPGSLERELWLRTQLGTLVAQSRAIKDRIMQVLPQSQLQAWDQGLKNAEDYLVAGGIQPGQSAATTTLSGVTAGGQQVSMTGNLPGFNLTNATEKGFLSPSITRQQIAASLQERGFGQLLQGPKDAAGRNYSLADVVERIDLVGDVSRQLREGFLVGETNDEIARRISYAFGHVGGRNGGKVWAMTQAVVRTSMAEASQAAHDAFYKANEDLLIPTKSGFRWWWDASNDTRLCPECAPMDGVKYKNRDDVKGWPRHFSCVLGETKVSAAGLVSATRAWYSGDIVTIRTRSGRKLSVTSQHPMMSVTGWVRAADVRVGMKLICQGAGLKAIVLDPDLNNGPATAADVFAAFRASSEVSTMSVPASPMDFHGDGVSMKSDVEVVTANRPLVVERDFQEFADGSVVPGDAIVRLVPESALGDLGAMFVALSSAANGVVSLASESLSLIRRGLSHAEEHSFAAIAYGDARLSEPSYECGATAADLLGELLHGHPAFVESDEVSEIEVEASHGVWVYDFGAAGYAYAAEGILSHNCRCKILPITATMELLEEEEGPAKGSFLEATPVEKDSNGKRKPPPPGYTGDNAYKRPMKIDGKQQWVRRRDLGPGQTTAGDMLKNTNEHSKKLVLGKHTDAFNKLTGKGGKYEKDPQGAVRQLLGNPLPPGSTPPRPTRGPGPKPVPPAPKAPATPKPKAAPTPAPLLSETKASKHAETTKDINFKYNTAAAKKLLGYESDSHLEDAFDSIRDWTGGSSSDLRAAQFAEAQKAGATLTPYEKKTIERAETRPNGSMDLFKAQARSVEDFITRAPKYEGTVYRGVGFRKAEDAERWFAQLHGGEKTIALESWSVNEKMAGSFARGREVEVVMTVKENRYGAPIMSRSAFKPEEEVVMPRGVRYRVANTVKKELDHGRVLYEVELEQLPREAKRL